MAVAENALPGGEVAKRLRPGFERNLLCGVAEGCNRGVGLALIQSIDFHRRTVLLISPVPVEKVGVLQLGDLYVGLDGRELGQVGRERP